MRRKTLALVILTLLSPAWAGRRAKAPVPRDSHCRIARSEKAKAAFKREHPCPTTGKRSGSCPGYVIDHVKPLACGGADAPSNMQWQTYAESKRKDGRERDGCQ
jgi:hypothetical protein